MEELVLDWFKYNPWVIWPTTALLVVVCIQVWFYARFPGGVFRESRRQLNTPAETNDDSKPGVSVIVCSHDQATALTANLSFLLNQDYPEYQVVVVNSASTDDTEDVLQRFESYPNFYHTFVPPDIRNVSFRKMAMTIGLKAAKYDFVVFIDPMGVPAGSNWLSTMMRQVDKDTGLVLGYAFNRKEKGFWNSLVAYDALFSVTQFLGFALKRHAYRAHPSNLAFRKELFFSKKGFSSHLFLQSGADDLLIREMATSTNVRVELKPESFVRMDQENTWSAWKNELLNHLTTSGLYKPGVRFLLLMEGLSRFLLYVLMVFLLPFTLINGLYAWMIVAGLLLLTRFIVQGVVISKTASQLNASPSILLLPVYDVLIPVVKLYLKLTYRSSKGNAYTWDVLR
jgi:glycosyltransferase involved in cell wall biosynthesis